MSDDSDTLAEDAAPGWDAITAEFERLYPDQEPKHWGTALPFQLGGKDPIDGISAWKRLAPAPHWHFVTYGFSELYGKDSDILDQSGWGFELTLRLACDPDDETPPTWVFSMLQNLARYVFGTGNVFADGHWMNANGPIALETNTKLCSLAFITDPELPQIDTPHGQLAFLQIVGLTIEEEEAIKSWNTRRVLEILLPAMPLWITDLARGTLLDQPDIVGAIATGAAEDGSSTGMLYTEKLNWETRKPLLRPAITAVTLGANQLSDIVTMLGRRLPKGQEVLVANQATTKVLTITSGDANSVAGDDKNLFVVLTPTTTVALTDVLRPKAGDYSTPGLPALTWRVERSEIRDASGNVIRIVG